MTRWICPSCEREFGATRQAHVCAPGISVADFLGRHPAWVGEIYRALIEPLRELGPVHEDAVGVGIFLKSDRSFAQFRPRKRSVLLWLILPERREAELISRVLRTGRRFAHGAVLTSADQVTDQLSALLAEAYDHATD